MVTVRSCAPHWVVSDMTAVLDTVDPQAIFPDFYGSPATATLAGAARWTVSGRLGEESKGKAPIDMRHLLDTGGRVRGAWARDEQCLVTLNELTERLPNAANAAFYLQSLSDGLMVIDIEPDCPAEISSQLLTIPEAIYTETSMSGKGFHLVAPLPENFHDHKAAVGKKVLREEHGYYEILLEHWCTFTRRPIAEDVWDRVRDVEEVNARYSTTSSLYASLARSATATQTVSTEVATAVEAPEIAGREEIVLRTLEGVEGRLKTIDDFDGDASRFEFSVLGTLRREMQRQLVVIGFLKRARYTDSDVAWLLYEAAREILPHRTKHRERRNGRTFLLDRAAAMVAENKTNGSRNRA